MTDLDLLRELMSGMSQNDFAATIGVSKGHMSLVLSGQRNAGRRFVARLLAVYPFRRSAILAAFYPKEAA